MRIAYKVQFTNGELGKVILETSETKIRDLPNIETASIDILGTIREKFFPTNLNDLETQFFIKAFLKLKKQNKRVQQEIPRTLANNPKKKIRKLSKMFEDGKNAGVPLAETIKDVGLPRYVEAAMVSAQKSSNEEKTYENLVEMIQIKTDAQKVISSSLRYPKIVYGIITLVVMFFMFFLIPKNQELLKVLDVKISWAFSKWLYETSAWAVLNKTEFVIKLLICSFLAYKLLYFLITQALKLIPYIKRIVVFRENILFFGLMESLTLAGTSQGQAIKLSGEVFTKKKMRENFSIISHRIIKDGDSFSQCLEDIKYDEEVIFFIREGEITGGMVQTYADIKNSYKEELNERMEKLLPYVGVFSMLMVAIILITLFLGVYMPMVSIASQKF